jgi:hypothetical protein
MAHFTSSLRRSDASAVRGEPDIRPPGQFSRPPVSTRLSQSLGLSGAKTPCPYADYADQYPKGNMTDTELCFGVFARMQT